MDTVEVSSMGVIDGSGVFSAQMLSGAQPIIFTQDAGQANSDDLSSYGNKVILMQFVQGNETSSVVNGYVLNDAQVPVVSQQLFLTQDNFLAQAVDNVGSKLLTFDSSLTSVLPEDALNEKDIDDPSEDLIINDSNNVGADETDVFDDEVANNEAGEHFCYPCGLHFDSVKLFKKHNRQHLLEKPFKCHLCQESFNYEINLSLHLATHEVDNPFCPVCKKRFRRVAGLKAHIMLHEKEETLFCPECGDEFTSQMFLDEHLNEHRTEIIVNKPPVKIQYNCLQCLQKFSSSRSLKEHCKIFHRMLSTKKSKRRRKNACVCPRCQKSFEKPSQLSRHYRIHTGERPFQCELCPRAFNQKGSLQIHMLKHTGAKPHKCKHCHAAFSQKGNLQAHIQKLHTLSIAEGRIHKCPHCTCIFGKGVSLRTHITKVHGVYASPELSLPRIISSENIEDQQTDSSNKENEVTASESEPKIVLNIKIDANGAIENKVNTIKWHRCSYCSKEFKRSSDLIRHIKIHTREKPFTCKLCFRTFTVRSALGVHMRCHSEELLKNGHYLCDICDKVFSSSTNFKLHKKTHETTKYPESNSDTTMVENDNVGEEETNKEETEENVALLSSDNENRNEENEDRLIEKSTEDSSTTKPFKCNSCDASFKKESQLKFHKQMHVVEKPYKCPECKASFIREMHLKMHYRMHTGEKPFQCSVCNADYSSKNALKKHMLKKHNSINFKHFKCEECGKQFFVKSSLRRHIDSAHSSDCTYVCPVCKNGYKTYASCQQHLLTHDVDSDPKAKPMKINGLLNDSSSNITNSTTTTNDIVADNNLTSTFVTTTAENNEANNDNQLNEILKTLSHGHQVTITQDENGVYSLVETDQQSVLPTDQTEIPLDQSSVFTNKTNAQLFQTISDVQKTTLYGQNFDSCLFIQNDNLEFNGSIMDTANLATILQQATSVHRCDVCSLEFQLLEELNLHKSVHLVKKEKETIICVPCHKLFASAEEYEEHVQCHYKENYKNDNNSLHCCTICNMNFQTEDELSEHYSTHLKENSIPEKTKVPTKGRRKNVLLIPAKDPSKNIVNGKKKTILLGKRAQNVSAILESILQMDKVKKEIKTEHHNKCTYCPKSFRKPSDLARHLRIHTGERPYECPKCNKTFNVKSTADCHMKTHTKDRSYRCNICSKTFATSGSLNVHHRLHTGVKPYKCPLCDARFRTSGHKLTHIKSHIKRLTQTNTKKITIPLSTEDGGVQDSTAVVDSSTAAIVNSVNVVDDMNAAGVNVVNHIEDHESHMLEDDEHDPATEFLNNISTIQLNSAAKANKNDNESCLLADFDQQSDKLVTISDANSQFILQAVGNENDIESRTYVVSLDQSTNIANADNILQDIDCLNKKSDNHGSVLVNASLLSNDQAVCHNSKYQCTFCKEHFQTELQLNEHSRKLHEDEFHQCMDCHEKFSSKTDLEVHTVEHLTLDSSWTCHTCSENFADGDQLRCHKCNDSDQVVKTSSLVEQHSPTFDLNTVVSDFFLFSS
ncbi:hypothetical protein O3M35_013027 [Rhynocoris fuscipes]|uniref:C2H2-type domain-containing protein n=1 Tax=Rhynocoris fuscipes TaxID=488301 RepID=A0AAW1CED0_9HEMI